jgi:ribosomal protein L40E
MRLPRRMFGPSCLCGARLSKGAIVCRKCRARARWLRRKSRYPDL